MLSIHNIHKSFGSKQALAGVSFDINSGEILAVLGPSGCGKSTLLNIVAGLEVPDQGEVLWAGASLAGIPPHKRGFGLMFQDFALFPHKNVYENVAFGLRMQRLSDEQIRTRARQALELVGLPEVETRDVNTLSGGEQQRVALARALAAHPRLLMLDEPLGSLDRGLRERLVLDLRAILQRSGQTAIYVTHDQEEAFTLADRLVLMSVGGKIEQIAPPEQIYHQPANPYVASFLGLNNLLQGKLVAGTAAGWLVETPIGQMRLPVQSIDFIPGQQVTLLLRPDAIRLGGEDGQRLRGRLAEVVFRGSLTRATLFVENIPLTFDFSSYVELPAVGESIEFSFDPVQALQIFPP